MGLRASSAAVAVLILVGSGLPFAARDVPRVPFTTNAEGLVFIPATIGDGTQVKVVLDTGAGLDVLAPSVIAKAGGQPRGQFSGFRMTGERVDLPLFQVPRITVGPLIRTNALVGSWDVLDAVHLEGVVSLNGFRRQPVTIDFPAGVVVFESDATLRQRRHAGGTTPLLFDDQRGIALDIFADFLIGGERGTCEIDTGSPTVAVSTRYMAPLRISKDAADVRTREGTTIAGARSIRYETTLPNIALAAAPDVSVRNVPVGFSDIIYDCLVGVGFWAGRALTIDIAGRELTASRVTQREPSVGWLQLLPTHPRSAVAMPGSTLRARSAWTSTGGDRFGSATGAR